MIEQNDLTVPSLAECRHASPLNLKSASDAEANFFVSDSQRIRLDVMLPHESASSDPLSLELAGPLRQVFFGPEHTCAANVTCRGLSPGLNNVIRSVYHELTENYGVRQVLGIRNGYLGLNPESDLGTYSS